jgi:hypothetical protein
MVISYSYVKLPEGVYINLRVFWHVFSSNFYNGGASSQPPSEDPEWWADLASQLPAAWGNGAFDTARRQKYGDVMGDSWKETGIYIYS